MTKSFLLTAFSGLAVFAAFAQHDHDHEAGNLIYIENKGQWQPAVLFQAEMHGGSLFLEPAGFTFSQYSSTDLEAVHEMHHTDPVAASELPIHGHAWKTIFTGANPKATISGDDKRPEYHNYFIGNDAEKWASEAGAYNGVIYNSLYAHIDLHAYSHDGNLKYDFVVKPKGDPADIQLTYEGIDHILLRDGNVVLQTSVGDFIEMAPVAFQVIDGQRVEVACMYGLENNTVTFHFPNGYDSHHELIIDPVLVAASLSGTVGGMNFGHCATYDNGGNIYSGAINFGSGYPATVGAFQTTAAGGTDIAVSKLSPNGTSLIYATHLGGNGGDYPHSMIVSAGGELYVLGSSASANFPVTAGAFDNTMDGTNDIVLSHFNATCTALIGSTFVGGTSGDGNNSVTFNYGDYYRGEIILDNAGNAYVASTTTSNNFPVTVGAHQTLYGGGASDAVFFCITPNMSTLNWSTYLGAGGDEAGFGLRLDDQGHVYACGAANQSFMTATGYKTTHQGDVDGYVVEITNDGQDINRSTYWGTASSDNSFFLDIDDDGFIYIYGQSDGGSSVVTPGVYSNPSSGQYIAKLDSTLNTLGFGTVIGSGGPNEFVPIAFMVDGCGYIYFSGHSSQMGMPLTTSPIQSSGGFYLGVLDPNATGLYYATYYGGPGDHVDGGTSRFDPNGIVYQGVCTGGGFATTPGAYGTVSGGGWDIGVFKINFEVNPLQASAAASPAATGCAPFDVTFDNTSTGTSYEWDFGDGSPVSTSFEPTHTFTNPGTYEVMLIAHDPASCNQHDTTYVTIIVGSGGAANAQISYTSDCATGTVTVSNTGSTGESFTWNMGDGTTYSGPTASHTYATTGTYTVTLTANNDLCGTSDVETVDIAVGSAPMTVISNDPVCYQFSDGSVTLNVSGTTGSETYVIENAAGTVLNLGGSNTANNLPAGWYYYTVDLGNGCATSDSIELINPAELDVMLNITNPLCYGLTTGVVIVDTVLNWQGNYNNIGYFWNPNPGGVSGIGADTATNYGAGNYTLTINDQNGCSNVFDFVITQPDSLFFVELGSDPAYCRTFDFQFGHGRVFAAASGGTPDYSYVWTNLQTGATTTNTTWGGLNPGDYQIVATDDNGCTLTATVNVSEVDPLADFTLTSADFTAQYEGTAPVTVTFTNESMYFANPNDPLADTTFFWNFNTPDGPWIISHDLGQTFDTTYLHGGTYTVCLVAMNSNDCKDTMCVDIIVYDPMVFEPINVFTPDGDGINDEFTFLFRSDAIKTFNCVIVNRWGVTIAEFDNITDKWDGRDKNGDLCPDGVYFYTYEGEADNGELFSGQGTATVAHGKK